MRGVEALLGAAVLVASCGRFDYGPGTAEGAGGDRAGGSGDDGGVGDAAGGDAPGGDAGGGDAFDPGMVGTLIGWWRADSVANRCGGGTSCDDGEPVDWVEDVSGSGGHMTQAPTAERPTFVASCAGSRPCLRFTAGQYLSAPTPLATVAEWTIVAVMRIIDCPGDAPTQNFCAVLIDATDSHIEGIYVHGPDKRLGLDASTAPLLSSYGATSLPTSSLSLVDASRGAAAAYEIYVGGTLDGTGTYPAPKVGDAFSQIGYPASPTLEFTLAGDIAELLVFAGVLDTATRTAVRGEVRGRYGL